jgi:hypothetical protein
MSPMLIPLYTADRYRLHMSHVDLLNKSPCLAPALGVTKVTIVTGISLVTLCCVTWDRSIDIEAQK